MKTLHLIDYVSFHFMNYYIQALKKYFVFSGRARRSEYWYFALFNFIIIIALQFLANIVGDIAALLLGIYALFVFIPGLSVLVRRLHDVGKSGWMILIALIPIIGGIWLLILTIRDSNPGDNVYGPNPKNTPAQPVVPAV